jgi:hypothetical protein
MRYVKILGLLAVCAAALMAFAATASAAKVTSPAGTKYFGVITAESEGHATLHPSGEMPDVTCNSTVKGEVAVNDQENGNPTTKASGPITELNWFNCTNSYHATTNAPGSLSIESLGGGTGTLYSTGTTVTVTRFGIECRYLTSTTDIGVVTDSNHTGGNATLDIKAKIPFHNGSFLCGEGLSEWTGSYKVTSPKTLIID